MLQKNNRLLYFVSFVFFFVLIFIAFNKLFFSYFEADEWYHFTHYLPLIHQDNGWLIALTRSVTDTQALSEGQHIDPLSVEIFFFNTQFFGINFIPYSFMSLFFHTLNSFLVFIFMKQLLTREDNYFKNTLFALMGGVFFSVTAIPMHNVTWAAFYGQNVISTTFFLLSLLFLKFGISSKKRKFIFLSALFFLLDLLTKEIAVVLVFIIPFIIFLEKKNFPVKFLASVYLIPVLIFFPFRFLLPTVYNWYYKVPQLSSIHLGLRAEISLLIYRMIIFPFNMISQVFFSRETIVGILQFLAPILYYQYAGEPASRTQYRYFFILGPGNNFLLDFFAIGIIILFILLLKKFYKEYKQEFITIAVGFFVILINAFPLVFNVLRIPSWGTDYFDQRDYYMPSVGAALLFPFFLFAISEYLVKFIRFFLRKTVSISLVVFFLFFGWYIGNLFIFKEHIKTFITQTGYPRSQLIKQMQQYFPELKQKTVIFAETEGGGPYGPSLPFQTSIPQVLSVAYYGHNTLPDSFYNNFILNAQPEGYQFADGRGFGYYSSKEKLKDAVRQKKFAINDIYAFHFDYPSTKLTNITDKIRSEITSDLQEEK